MNNEHSHPGGAPTSPDPGHPEPSGGFFAWIRSLRITRRSDDRWFAGVASGVAERLNIDPLIVRGIFIVLAVLGGPGILLYLIGWLFLPDVQNRIHVQELFRGRATTGVTVLAILVGVWFIGGFFSSAFLPSVSFWRWDLWNIFGIPKWILITSTWIFWITVIVLAAFVIQRVVLNHGRSKHRQTEQSEETSQAGAADTGASEQTIFNTTTAAFVTDTKKTIHDFEEKITDWGKDFGNNVSAQTSAWSANYAEHHERFVIGRAHKLITAALALIAGSLTALWVFQTGGFVGSVFPNNSLSIFVPALIVATAVYAVSMIIAGIRGKKSGSIGFFGFVGVIALVISAILPWGSQFYWAGNTQVGSEVPAVVMFAGDMDVDLTEFDTDFTQDSYAVNMLFGDILVTLPEHRPTIVHILSGAGQVFENQHDLKRNRSGVLTNHTIKTNEDETGKLLTVNVTLLAGNVTVDDSATRGMEMKR